MSVAVITNSAPPYRIPLFEILTERLGATFYFHGDELSHESVAGLPFPAHHLSSQLKVFKALSEPAHRAVICGLSGRVALPVTYLTCRRKKLPFILWASLWSHPETAFHRLSSLPLRKIYTGADAVVTYGPHVSEYVESQRGGRAGIFEATQAVDNGFFSRQIATEEQSELRDGLGLGDRPVVLFVGRLVEEKGLRYLLKAWHRLELVNDEVLVIAGEGPLAGEAGDWPDVKFIGLQSRESLPALYSIARVLVLPSIQTDSFLEPWGLVVNEAMNQGTPVIATESVGAVAVGLVRDGINGLVVPERNSAELAGAIGRLLADERFRDRLGAQAKADVGRYTYDIMVDGFRQALDHALSN